jgi:DNA repair photolyase
MRLPMMQPRHETADPCSECRMCGGVSCEAAKKSMRKYSGIRFTADGFDCALPVTIDSHSCCSFACLYCFSEQLGGHTALKEHPVGQTPLSAVEAIFSGGGGADAELFRKALKYDRRNKGGFSCPVQLGGINDPGDNIERHQGWFLKFAELAIKYNQPVRISTKGTTFREPDYLRVFSKAPHLFWVAFSIITCDDELIERIDIGAPNATERLETMRVLSKIGVSTSLRFRPMFPGISDRTARYRQVYKVLIEKAAKAGCRAVSYECGFYPMSGLGSAGIDKKWNQMAKVTHVPFKAIFDKIGSNEACRRASPAWTENIMHAVREEAKKHGLVVGVSDPIWKQLSDTGCCCGMLPDDPVFGNWERENATEALLKAKNEGVTVWPEDIVPPWADERKLGGMFYAVGPNTVWRGRHTFWGDQLRKRWNTPKHQRGPLVYFQGALRPVEVRDNGDVGYRYVGLERRNVADVPFWDISPGKPDEVVVRTRARHCKLVGQCDGTRCPKCIEKR